MRALVGARNVAFDFQFASAVMADHNALNDFQWLFSLKYITEAELAWRLPSQRDSSSAAIVQVPPTSRRHLLQADPETLSAKETV